MDKLNKIINKTVIILFSLIITVSISGCEVIGDIFKAGIWVGVIIVVVIIAIIFFIFKK